MLSVQMCVFFGKTGFSFCTLKVEYFRKLAFVVIMFSIYV